MQRLYPNSKYSIRRIYLPLLFCYMCLSAFPLLKNNYVIMPLKTKFVAHTHANILLQSFVGDDLDLPGYAFVQFLYVYGGRYKPVLHGHYACDSLYSTRAAQQVARHGFGGAYGQLMICGCQQAMHRLYLTGIANG